MAACVVQLALTMCLSQGALSGRVRQSDEALAADAGQTIPVAMVGVGRVSQSQPLQHTVQHMAQTAVHPWVGIAEGAAPLTEPAVSADDQESLEPRPRADAAALLNQLPVVGAIPPTLGLEVIGTGASADILSTTSTRGQHLAVKMVTPGCEEEAAKVLRDIEVMKLFKGHPGFVDIYTATDTRSVRVGRNVYIVMERAAGDVGELVIGKSLEEVPKSTRVRLFMQVLSAVADMARHGVMHRDLKPANVLIRGDLASAVLCDFETACTGRRGGQWQCMEVRATPGFIPPEVWKQGTKADSLARDVWALGIFLYQVLHGTMPAGLPKGAVEEVGEHFEYSFRIEDDVVWQTSRTADTALAELMRRMLEHDPRRRVTAEAALQEMLVYASEQGIDVNLRVDAGWDEKLRKVEEDMCQKLRKKLGQALRDLWRKFPMPPWAELA